MLFFSACGPLDEDELNWDEIGFIHQASTCPNGGNYPPQAPSFGSAIDNYASYVGQSTCDPTPKPGVTAFRDFVLAAYPCTSSSGISRDCNVGGTSEHKEGRAWDWGIQYPHPAADALLNWLLAPDQHGNQHAMARRFGIMYMIWNYKIWKAYQPEKGWQSYTGSNPHTDHVHFSFSWDGANKATSFWTAQQQPTQPPPPPPPPPPPGNTPPWGTLESISCAGGLVGWARDPDTTTPVQIQVTFDLPADDPTELTHTTQANLSRPELCPEGGPCNQGFQLDIPPRYFDNSKHMVRVYVIDTADPEIRIQLSGSPVSLSCASSDPGNQQPQQPPPSNPPNTVGPPAAGGQLGDPEHSINGGCSVASSPSATGAWWGLLLLLSLVLPLARRHLTY